MRKFFSFVAIASLSVCAFAQEANVTSPSDLTITSQPSVVEPAPVADQTVMVMAASPCGCNGMYTSTQAAGCCATASAAPACGTCDSCCETGTGRSRGLFTRLRSRGNNDCCQTAAPACNTCDTCNTCNTCDNSRGVFARTPILNRNNNNCCQTVSVAPCSTCATATYTSAPMTVQEVAAPVVVPAQDFGGNTVVNSCCQPAVTDCCETGRTRILGSRPARTRLLGRRGNNCGC